MTAGPDMIKLPMQKQLHLVGLKLAAVTHKVEGYIKRNPTEDLKMALWFTKLLDTTGFWQCIQNLLDRSLYWPEGIDSTMSGFYNSLEHIDSNIELGTWEQLFKPDTMRSAYIPITTLELTGFKENEIRDILKWAIGINLPSDWGKLPLLKKYRWLNSTTLNSKQQAEMYKLFALVGGFEYKTTNIKIDEPELENADAD